MSTPRTKAPSTGSPMRKIVFRNLLAHKVRLGLTVLSVVLGTAFIAGSFMFTATLQSSFDRILENTMEGVDVVVRPEGAPGTGAIPLLTPGEDGRPVDVAARIAAVPGVANVNLDYSNNSVGLVDENGKAVNTGGAPAIGIAAYPEDRHVGRYYPAARGRMPENPGEIALNSSAAKRAGLTVGDRTRVYTRASAKPGESTTLDATVVGIYEVPTDVGGFIGVALTPAQAQEILADKICAGDGDPRDPNCPAERIIPLAGGLTISAEPGVTAAELRDRVSGVLSEIAATNPAFEKIQAITGEKERENQVTEISKALSFLNYFLVAFGAIALLVGTFIIYNTFSMIVAQRLRELALLRAIGASRRQITRSVVAEAAVVGVVGSALGVAAGLGLVRLLKVVFEAAGIGLPAEGVSTTTASVAVPLVVGLLVTVVSAWAPARRAGGVPPVAAMRTGDAVTEAALGLRTIIGGVLAVLGIVAAIAATRGTTMPYVVTVGIGAAILLIGLFLALPAIAGPVVGAIGRVVGLPYGAIGRVAGRNAVRAPRRTAATAFALTLGLCLVSVIGMFGSSMDRAISGFVDTGIKGSFIVSAPRGFPTPTDLVDKVADVDGVKGAGYVEIGSRMRVDDGPEISALAATVRGDARGLGDFFATELDKGELPDAPGEIALQKSRAAGLGIGIGDTVTITGPGGAKGELTVTGTFSASANVMGDAVLVPEDLGRLVPQSSRFAMGVFVTEKGANSATLRKDLEAAVAEYPIVQVKSKAEFKGEQAAMVTQMLGVLYGLLGLAVVIAILGIVNTLALSVVERRREIGMYRALGMQRRQLRRAIRLESVQIAIFGAIVGVLVGLFVGWAFLSTMRDQGLSEIAVPWGTIAIVLAGSGVVGVLASLWPARRAARTKPLDAIHA